MASALTLAPVRPVEAQGELTQRPAFYIYVALVCTLYVVVAGRTPLVLLSTALGDDGLFLSLGKHLANGEWLGPYDQATFVKGPGYPVFLALANWLALPITVAHALFHAGAALVFVLATRSLVGSRFLSAGLLTLLVWHPATLAGIQRILREQIYSGQMLLALGLLVAALFVARTLRWRVLLSATAGLVLAWFWLTREEGLWITPGIILLIAGATLLARRQRRPGLARVVAALILAFAGTQIAFSAVNWWVYGSFVGVEVKEANFSRALGDIHSVRSGGIRPYVSVTTAARQQIYRVSPAFALLETRLEGNTGWVRITCDVEPEACGEIGAGWFLWALRDAAAAIGQYRTPAKASAFFGRMADEIEAACARGDLQCQPQVLKEMPPYDVGRILAGLGPGYLEAFDTLLLRDPPLGIAPGSGGREVFDADLRFLHNPPHTASVQVPVGPRAYALSGWFSGEVGISLQVDTANGDFITAVRDVAPPDGQLPERRRFTLATDCSADCVFSAYGVDQTKFEAPLGSLSPIGLDLGRGHLEIDDVGVRDVSPPVPTGVDAFAERVRIAVVANYHYVFIPCLAVGVLCFVICTLIYPRRAWRSISYLLAVTFWVLVLSRMSILILIAMTAFPGLALTYFTPTYYVAIAAIVFSVAALFQAARAPAARPLARYRMLADAPASP